MELELSILVDLTENWKIKKTGKGRTDLLRKWVIFRSKYFIVKSRIYIQKDTGTHWPDFWQKNVSLPYRKVEQCMRSMQRIQGLDNPLWEKLGTLKISCKNYLEIDKVLTRALSAGELERIKGKKIVDELRKVLDDSVWCKEKGFEAEVDNLLANQAAYDEAERISRIFALARKRKISLC